MIYVKRAPKGYVAQYFTNEPVPHRIGLSIHGGRAFLGVTGKWAASEEEAVASVKAFKAKELARLRAKLKKVTESLETEIADLERTTDQVSRSWEEEY